MRIAWVLIGIVLALICALYALPWVSAYRDITKARSQAIAPPTEAALLRAELAELAAKHPPRTDGD